MATSDPLYPATMLIPTGSPGGLRELLPEVSGSLRPFAATLSVPHIPSAKKHDTNASRDTYWSHKMTINDGTQSDDGHTDVDIDD